MFDNDYRSVKAVIKLVLGFGFDFGNENRITCTRSNQHAFRNVLLAYENGLLLCLEKVLGTNRIKLVLVRKRWCELLSSAVMTGATRRASVNSLGRVSQAMNTPGRAPQRARPVFSDFTRCQLARASSET
ncbi:hypothetical protein QL285_056344 [Trifolium repens]|nr:hypothetical protein QL285_056344 [Trifolium repens]